MATPVVVVTTGGLAVTVSPNGIGTPMTAVTSGGIPVRIVTSGGMPVVGVVTGPDTTAPIITSSSTFSVAEGVAFSTFLAANEAVTWAKVGGADAAKFTLTAGQLTMPAKDYEAPDDADANRAYVVQVQATDLASNVSTIQTITVTVTDVFEDVTPPTITSASTFSTPEGIVYNHQLTANEIVTWSIFGGVDANQFSIVSGDTLRMVAQDYELATTRTVIVRATDAVGLTTNQTITATITDVVESVDDIPDPFTFTDATGVELSTLVYSNFITVSGLGASVPATMTITGGDYSKNGNNYVSTPTTVFNSNTIRVRGTSSALNSTAVDVTLTIGGVSDTFTITTVAIAGILTPSIDLAGMSDTGSSSTDNITSNNTPSFDIVCATTPLVGDVIDLAKDGVLAASATLTADDISGITEPELALAPLTDGTYTFTARHSRGANVSSYSAGVSVTIDTVAPVLTAPGGVQNGTNQANADLSVTTNTGQGIIYWVVQPAAMAPPTTTQIIDGIRQDGFYAPAGHAGNFTVATTGAKTATATGFSVTGNFKVYFTHEDVAGNIAAMVTSAQWTQTIASFTAFGVGGFDGSTTYMTNTSLASSIAAGKQGLVSFWIKMLGGAGTGRYVFTITTTTTVKFWVWVNAANAIQLQGRNAAGVDIFNIQSVSAGTPLTPPPTAWVHVAAWWDLGTASGQVYINGSLSTSGSKTLTNDLIAYNQTTALVGTNQGIILKHNGSLSELYVNLHETLDLSNSTNLQKFIAGGLPVQLGATGTLPTGTQPEFYLGDNNTFADWGTNNGSKSNFTVPAGALTSVTGPP